MKLFKALSSGAIPAGMSRASLGARAGVFGICLNLLLAAAKASVGVLSGSVSVVADGINNLTDAASSVVAAIGFRIASRPADEDHPYGHARSEYIAALFVAVFLLFFAFETFKSSVERILSPVEMRLSGVLLGVLIASIVLKLLLFFFYRRLARVIDSPVLSDAAKDSLGDAALTFMVLLCAALSPYVGFSPDGPVGILISIVLFFAGYRSVRNTLSELLGKAPSPELLEEITSRISEKEEVLGVHDLVVHSYGEGRVFASVHVELSDRVDFLSCHELIDQLERSFLDDGIALVIHPDPMAVGDPLTDEVRTALAARLSQIDGALDLHDFRILRAPGEEGGGPKRVSFDIRVPVNFAVPDEALLAIARDVLYTRLPEAEISAHIDRGYTKDGYAKEKNG